MSPPEMPGQPLSKNILQVLLGGRVLKRASLVGKQKLFENKAFKAIMRSVIRHDSLQRK